MSASWCSAPLCGFPHHHGQSGKVPVHASHPAQTQSLHASATAGKLQTLSALLSGIIAEGSKVVVVSTSTTALDMIDALLCAPNR